MVSVSKRDGGNYVGYKKGKMKTKSLQRRCYVSESKGLCERSGLVPLSDG